MKLFRIDTEKIENGSLLFYSLRHLGECIIREWNSPLTRLQKARKMFYGCSKLTTFASDLSSLTDGYEMFVRCSNLITFNSDLSSLTNGGSMFYRCIALETFESDLSSLTNGEYMFYHCDNLSTFSSDSSGSPVNLSNLTDGYRMFIGCSNLNSFSSDIPSLMNGSDMFRECSQLTSFSSDLSSLTDGNHMLRNCSVLTSFVSDLSKLTNGSYMFSGCKLDTASVQNIADTINTPSDKGTIDIGIGNSTPNEQEEEAFNAIASRNWKVYVNGANNPWTSTDGTAIAPIDGEQTTTPIPFWAKPVPATEETAEYIDTNGNFYNVLGAQFIYGDDISTYGMFISEEDAAANMRLTKIERN